MNNFKFKIGDNVKGIIGEGIVIDRSVQPYDGNCYTIKLSDGRHVIRTEKSLTINKSLSEYIAEKFNLNSDEVTLAINEFKEIGG